MNTVIIVVVTVLVISGIIRNLANRNEPERIDDLDQYNY